MISQSDDAELLTAGAATGWASGCFCAASCIRAGRGGSKTLARLAGCCGSAATIAGPAVADNHVKHRFHCSSQLQQ